MCATSASVLNVPSLQASYRFCRKVARQRAKNFYYSFLLLDQHQRDAMCAIYAFMRHCDDLSDDPAIAEPSRRYQRISEWRMAMHHALRGDFDDGMIWPAFADSVRRYAIPHRFFDEMIDGITSDLDPEPIKSFEDLYRYCYRVASVVGLTIIYIFGFRSMHALVLAEKCGVAFQLTNILRDIREDASMDRIYLPADDLRRFSVPVEQLKSGTEDDAFRRLMGFEMARARAYYDESARLSSLIEPKSRRSLWALREIYLTLLNRIEQMQGNVLSQRINVPTRTKVGLLVQAAFRPKAVI